MSILGTGRVRDKPAVEVLNRIVADLQVQRELVERHGCASGNQRVRAVSRDGEGRAVGLRDGPADVGYLERS